MSGQSWLIRDRKHAWSSDQFTSRSKTVVCIFTVTICCVIPIAFCFNDSFCIKLLVLKAVTVILQNGIRFLYFPFCLRSLCCQPFFPFLPRMGCDLLLIPCPPRPTPTPIQALYWIPDSVHCRKSVVKSCYHLIKRYPIMTSH